MMSAVHLLFILNPLSSFHPLFKNRFFAFSLFIHHKDMQTTCESLTKK